MKRLRLHCFFLCYRRLSFLLFFILLIGVSVPGFVVALTPVPQTISIEERLRSFKELIQKYRDQIASQAQKQESKQEDRQDLCAQFIKWSQNEAFILKDLAFLYSLTSCQQGNGKNQSTSLEEKKRKIQRLNEIKLNSPWLQKRVEEIEFRDSLSENSWLGREALKNRNFNLARQYFRKNFESSNSNLEERIQSFKLYRNSYKVEGEKKAFIAQAKKTIPWLIKNKATPLQIEEAYLVLVKAYWTEGNIKEATSALLEAEKYLANKKSLEEFSFLRGKMAEERKDCEQAIKAFDQALLLTPVSRVSFLNRVQFQKAWCLRKLNKNLEAIIIFASLKETSQDLFEKYKYSYWLGRTKKEANEKNYLEIFKELSQKDLFGYYGLLAFYELEEPLTALKNKDSQLSSTLPSNSPIVSFASVSSETLQALFFLEERDLLESCFDLIFNKKLNASNSSSVSHWLKLYNKAAELGVYQSIFSSLGKLDENVKNQIFLNQPELFFPILFKEQIDRYSLQFKIQKEIILSIMRQESSFNPKARSSADAFGLMQVLPSLAEKLLKNQNNKQSQTQNKSISKSKSLNGVDELYDPDINISVGSALLSQLLKKYNYKLIPVSASYNANSKAYENWKKNKYREGKTIEFIEEIPYDETKTYIKLVIRNYVFYKRRLSEEKTIPFPKEVLELE